eukprot:scaffold21352_cov48-Phaeocystis_antarctica.AAC.4
MHSTSSAWACETRRETRTMSHETCRCLMLRGRSWLAETIRREEEEVRTKVLLLQLQPFGRGRVNCRGNKRPHVAVDINTIQW